MKRLVLAFAVILFGAGNSALAEDCDTPPSAGITVTPKPTGIVTVTVPYSFPNTSNSTQRSLQVRLWDPAGLLGTVRSAAPAEAGGTWTFEHDMSCWHSNTYTYEVTATTCSTHTATGTAPYVHGVAPTVTVTYDGPDGQGHGTLHADYDFPNTGSPLQRHLAHWVHFTGGLENGGGHRPVERSGTWPKRYDMTCRTGTFEHEVVATTCSGETDSARFPVAVHTKPSVSASVGAMQDNGNVDISVDFGFPNTDAQPQRRVVIRNEDAATGGFGTIKSQTVPDQYGTLNATYSALCATGDRRAWVIATSCTGETAEDRQALPNPEKPSVSVALEKDPEAPGKIKATIDYDMKKGTANWWVELHLLTWTTADGQQHAGGLKFGAVPSARSGTLVHSFAPPGGAQQLLVQASAMSCVGRETSDASFSCDCETEPKSADPVFFSSGNVRVTDVDPLPAVAGHRLVRTYNSDEQVAAPFGRGMTTLFDRRMILNADPTEQIVSVVTATNEVVTFRGANGIFRQTWPRSRRAAGVLSYDGGAGTYAHRAAGASESAVFRASDGRLVALRDLATGREARIAYGAQGLPLTLTDAWSGTTWNLTADAVNRRITSITVSGRPDLTWSYAYDAAGNLLRVTAPGGRLWRTYEYSANRMTASYDALGNLIESHTYDANGYGISSTGPGDEIASIQYGLPGSPAGERVTRVTYKTGAVAEYTLRRAGGAYRSVRVTGGCASCGSGEGTYVHDRDGNVIREQGANGYVTERSFAGGALASEERFLKPDGCDPATNAQHCRLGPDDLAAVGLEPTTATIRTAFAYGDPLWPDRVTAVVTPSVVASGGERRETYAYHSVSGAVVSTAIHGWTGHPAAAAGRITTNVYYGDAGLGLAPAFDPGSAFSPAWLAFPQPAGLPRSIDGARTDLEDVSLFVYYPVHEDVPALLRGRLAATKNAAGHIHRFEEYDVFGNATRTVDRNGVASETQFDALGRPTASILEGISGCDTAADPLCATDLTTTREYLDAGPLVVEQRPLGGVSVSTHDERGRVRTVSRGPAETDLRERIEISYDPLTGKKSVERMLAFVSGSWTETRRESFVYDSRGRLQRVTHADGAAVHYTYDSDDRVATVRDETHAAPNAFYAYDPAGRLAVVRQTLAGAPNGQIATGYQYDLHGNLTAVTDPNGNTTTYAYDDFGQLLSQQSPVTGTTTYRYDEAGNLHEVTDANGAVTVRQYDALNRPTSAVSTLNAASETVSWSYDDPAAGRFAIGRLAAMTDPAGSVEYRYERRGMLRQETRAASDGGTYVQRYGYDADGNRSAIAYPSGRVVTYQHDYAGRPLAASGTIGGQITPYVTAATYLPFGPLTSLGLGNGTAETRTFNARYSPATSSLTRGASTIAQYAYTNDPAGNITSITDGVDAGYSRYFGYDDLHRLTVANTGSSLWGAGSFTYDRMGNMLTATLGGTQRSFTHQGATPRIRMATGLSGTMAYDVAGNELDSPAGEPALGGTAAVRYSPRNLIEAQLLRTYDRCVEEHGSACTQPDPAEDWQSNVYDGRGVRVLSSRIVVAGSIGLDPPPTHVYFYTPELAMLNVVSHSTGRTADVIWFGSRPVADHGSSEVRYTYTDHLGTPILQTTASGTVTWRVEYEPYGSVYALRSGVATDDQPLRFPGQQVSHSTTAGEESYNIHRWYRGGWGRYTQVDPIGLRGGANLYVYVNDPVGTFDPYGLYKVDYSGLKSLATLSVLTACKTSPVACTLGLGAAVSFECSGCDGNWRATSVTLHVRGDIYAYSGNPKVLGKTIKDKSVVSFASAVQHEYSWHIEIAVAAVSSMLIQFESAQFDSYEACNDAGVWVNENVQSLFAYVYKETQKIEKAGGDPTKVPF